MARQTDFIPLTFLSVALTLELASGAIAPKQARAQSNLENQRIVRVTFDPPGEGKPTDSAGGASRGNSCPQEQTNVGGCVTPVMPATQQGLTVAERPTFFVYFPESVGKQVFFSLLDDKQNNIYQTKFPIASTSGIVSFQLPSEAPALEIGKNYQWSFIIIGENGLRPDSPGVRGEIQRIELSQTLKNQIEKVTPLERAALYAKEGIWFDTVGILADLRRSQPQDATFTENWEALLTSVGLDAIATKPLLK